MKGDNKLTMVCYVSPLDRERLATELKEWFKSHDCGMSNLYLKIGNKVFRLEED